jgi:tetratricopeptide (TPR) repeat protein
LSEPAGYAAFLSYSHRDKRWAEWLHRAVETYRVPSRIIGAAQLRHALRPIFRDRDELPASSDLNQRIEAAMATSRALIVLCSPDAAKSRWTNAEIAMFKRLHPDRPILAAIIAGTPFASEIEGREDEEAFPPALRFQVDPQGAVTARRAEPIAADLRPDADGRRLGKLKIIAGMLGVGLNELVRRETARRNRRLAAVAGVLLAGMTVTSGLAVYAFRQRTEALRQREQADGLIEFMLTDLRSKLEPVGRLDVLDSVGEKALRYYAAQDLSTLDADALGRRARALQLVGDVAGTQGNLDRALPLFQQASATTAELLRRDPRNPQRIFDHAQSVFFVGQIAWERGDLPAARRYFTQYRDFARKLTPYAQGKPAWAAESGYAGINLGSVELDSGEPAAALGDFRAAHQVFAELHARYPADENLSFFYGQALGWEADAARKLGDYPGALESRRQEIAVYQAMLARDAANTKASSAISNALRRSAQLQLDAGRPREAVALADRSLAVIGPLEAKDPTNGLWREMAVKSSNVRVEALMISGGWREAREENARAVESAGRLASTNRSIVNWRSECLIPARWMQIAIERALEGDRAMRGEVDRFARDFPEPAVIKDDDERFARAAVLLISGLSRRSLGETTQARADFDHAARLLPAPGAPVDARMAALEGLVYTLAPSAISHRLRAPRIGHYDLRPVITGPTES